MLASSMQNSGAMERISQGTQQGLKGNFPGPDRCHGSDRSYFCKEQILQAKPTTGFAGKGIGYEKHRRGCGLSDVF